MDRQTGSQAVDRAASLLVQVLQTPEGVSFGELVIRSQLPKSTASRLLASLERQGLLSRTDEGWFRPGPVITRFAHSSGAVDSLIQVARPFLARIGTETGETVNLAVPTATAVEQIAQVDSSYLLGAVNWVGRDVPFHCSALGKVFLAYGVASLPSGRLERRTPRTSTSRTELDREFARIRAQGFAVADSELEPGLVAIAAPVRGTAGAVVAAVSVTGPAVRLTPSRFRDIGKLLIEVSGEISAALGFPGETDQRSAERRKGRMGVA